jgi:hypothetical protein
MILVLLLSYCVDCEGVVAPTCTLILLTGIYTNQTGVTTVSSAFSVMSRSDGAVLTVCSGTAVIRHHRLRVTVMEEQRLRERRRYRYPFIKV